MTFRRHLSALVAFAALAGSTTAAEAITVLAQKGNGCSATWNTGQATATPNRNLKKPWSLTCKDGDSTCDADGTQNNECLIQIAACAVQTSPLCLAGPEQLTRLKLNGPARRAAIAIPAFSPQNCGLPGGVRLRLRKKGKNPSNRVSLVMNFKTTPSGSGKNVLQVQCIPNPSPPPPAAGRCQATCTNNPSTVGAPKQLCLNVPLVDSTGSNGSDLDTGYSGASHNFPVPAAATLNYCMSNCDGLSDTQCDLSGATGGGSLNGEAFGAPLPLLSNNLPVCVVNKFQPGPITGTFDVASGAGGPNPVNLFSETYLRIGVPDVCPRCVVPGTSDASAIGKSGTCSQTSTAAGQPCVVDGFVKVAGVSGDPNYTLSSSCKPPTSQLVGTLNIPLRLTTGTAESAAGPLPCAGPPVNQTIADSCGAGSCTATCTNCLPTSPPGECIDPKGGIAQTCCSNDSTKSCFPTKGGGTIQRQGKPGTTLALFASTFCIASTGSSSIDAVAGLPGPGALLLPGAVQVFKHVP